MSKGHAANNAFLSAPVGRLFMSNALPMTVVLSMGGILSVVDGVFVGHFVGAEALAAVSLGFPVVMILTALSTLIGGGMSSLMARQLGAGDREAAGASFARAHGLALVLSGLGIGLFLMGGRAMLGALAPEDGPVAAMAYGYLLILILAMPVQLILGLHADAFRNEGRAGLVALLSFFVNLANMAGNYALIVWCDLGLAGSALGTVLAQVLGLGLLILVRARAGQGLPLAMLWRHRWTGGWGPMLLLGAPLCLGFIGIAVVAMAVIVTLRMVAGADYGVLVAGYGVVTRLLGFAFLPQMAMALAMQSIVGNNHGAGLQDRAVAVLRLAMVCAFVWCLMVAVVLVGLGPRVGTIFANDAALGEAVSGMLRPMMGLYAFSGPVLVLALYFQAVGRPAATALLTLVKPWLLTPILVLLAGFLWGAGGIWWAYPLADGGMVMAALWLLRWVRKGA
ncbi:MATE family efflux transporter [Neogemmobacter tilapiae]|uniref:Multidrug export protein MepA n=1 Tax=Neogemmobacter tilapiae TaxID=875041 RepID=A0A918TNB6_9RHOB|nr:MATE family efflux transporter [Gemmobacter tilapiae]GHC54615.1 MATE family efflux transporter [Gemmobacter tilapiae]